MLGNYSDEISNFSSNSGFAPNALLCTARLFGCACVAFYCLHKRELGVCVRFDDQTSVAAPGIDGNVGGLHFGCAGNVQFFCTLPRYYSCWALYGVWYVASFETITHKGHAPHSRSPLGFYEIRVADLSEHFRDLLVVVSVGFFFDVKQRSGRPYDTSPGAVYPKITCMSIT